MASGKDAFIRKWAKIRKRGMIQYVLVHGAMGWGLLTALLSLMLRWSFENNFKMAAAIPSSLLACSLGGLLWGFVMWHYLDHKYKLLSDGPDRQS